jgi:hypothetical protein
MESKEITVCLTSCGRFDLLEKTVKSLIKYWDGPKPKQFLIYEDSGIKSPGSNDVFLALKDLISDFSESQIFLLPDVRVGQIAAIDFMYEIVTTPYIFHCEDDWEFYRTGFIQASFNVLEKHPDCINFWLREPQDTNGHPHRNGILKNNYRGQWGGFTFNPTLKRVSDYKRIGSYSKYTVFNRERPWESESKISMLYRRMGYNARIGDKGFVRHLGNNRHVE